MEIGGYRTEELIGRGGAAQVWRAVAPDGQRVALKVYSGPYEQSLAAAKREASLAAQIDHPHLAAIRAVVCDQDAVAVAVRWAAGGSLASVLRHRGMLTPGETLTVLIPIASALATAHERGVVHGDLSPANIVFDADGRPLLVDLGAAGIGVECGLPVSATPGYVAPEVARNAVPDPAADVFALGAVALHCLTGRPAWNADDLRDVVVQATVGQWPDPDDDAGPAPLLQLIRSMLGDVPAGRPGAATVTMELSGCGRPEPIALPAAGAVPRGRHAAPDSEQLSPTGRPAGAGLGDRPLTATRRRADAPVPATAEPARRRRRVGAKTIGLAVVALVIGVLAVQSGLIWGASSGRSGSAAPPVGDPGLTSGVGGTPTGTMAAGMTTSGKAVMTTSGPPGAGSAAAGAAGVGTSGSDPQPSGRADSSVPATSAAPATAATSTPAAPRPTTSTPTTSTVAPSTVAAAATPATSTEAGESRWVSVIRELDAARAQALVELDPERLAAVYTQGCQARAADAETITSLVRQRIRVDGAAHRIRRAQVLPNRGIAADDGARRVTVVVTDSLPSYRLLDADGAVVGRTTARPESTRTILLADNGNGYRIEAIHRS